MRQTLLVTLLASALLLAGCKTLESTGGLDNAISIGATAMKAVTLTDAEVVAMSDEACQALDAQNQLAPAGNKYSKRLKKVVAKLPQHIEGKKAVYKVYVTPEVNAWAMANGCIRVYSGLMDLMNDDELRGVIGHEMGHVALGHSKKAMQTAYATSAARQAAASSGGWMGALSSSQAGELGEKFLEAQFSQAQETDADNFAFDLLTQQKMRREGLVTGFKKLEKLSGDTHALLSSHPASADRARNIQSRLDAGQ